MKSQFLVFFILFSFAGAAFSQCAGFKIYRTTGEVNLMPGPVKGTALKNKILNEQSVLNIEAGGNVILLSGSDKALRINKPAKYTYADIHAMCQQNQTSLTKEYIKYVAQTITEKEEPLTAMVIKGAVYRTKEMFETTEMILPADSSVIFSETILFAWRPAPGGAAKYLKIYENGVREIFSKLLSDTTFIINSELFSPQKIYFWLVSPNQQPTNDEVRFTFVKSNPDWKTDFLNLDDQLMNELENEINATEKKLREGK